MKDEIRFKHAVMEYDHAIKYCKEVLASGATGDARKYAESHLKEAEKNKAKLLKSKDKLLGKKK